MPGRPAATGAPPGAPGKRPRAVPWLALVALAYALVQFVLVVPPLAHALGWDETVYVSQYDPRVPAAFFSAPRSRGISFLTAPFIAATPSVLVLRIGLTLLSSAALYAAFRVWRPVVGARTTALAALLFAGLWITQISGPQAMPNLWVAFGAVAATGWFLRAVTGREPRADRWLAGCVAATALFRAPDAVWLALPLIATALFRNRRTLPYLVGGLAVGLAQWVAEAYIRFGSVQDRLHVSSATEGDMGLHLNFDHAWSSLNGPLLCRPCTAATLDSPGLTLWWLALPLLAAAALAYAVRERRLPADRAAHGRRRRALRAVSAHDRLLGAALPAPGLRAPRAAGRGPGHAPELAPCPRPRGTTHRGAAPLAVHRPDPGHRVRGPHERALPRRRRRPAHPGPAPALSGLGPARPPHRLRRGLRLRPGGRQQRLDDRRGHPRPRREDADRPPHGKGTAPTALRARLDAVSPAPHPRLDGLARASTAPQGP